MSFGRVGVEDAENLRHGRAFRILGSDGTGYARLVRHRVANVDALPLRNCRSTVVRSSIFQAPGNRNALAGTRLLLNAP